VVYLILLFSSFFLGNYFKNKDIEQYKAKTFQDKVNKSTLYLEVLIKEKQNTTTTIGLGLANTKQIIDILKTDNPSNVKLNDYSLQLRQNTDFKNVWFQVISKDGTSIQRSWTGDKDDYLLDMRKDLKDFFQNPKITNTISVGRYDMTFKSMIPVYDYDGKNFIGAIEVITHFNSIAKKLKKDNIDAIFLVDKSYNTQIDKPFTKMFVEDYYVANQDVNKNLLDYFSTIKISKYIDSLKVKPYMVDETVNSLVSYFCIKCILGKDMGHVILFHNLDVIELSNLQEINYVFNLYILFFVIFLTLTFYFLYSTNVQDSTQRVTNYKVFAIMLLVYIVCATAIYKFIEVKYQQEIVNYQENVQQQTELEYQSIINRNKDLADLIFSRDLNNEKIVNLFKQRDREKIYELLEPLYVELRNSYSVRQIHFHLPDSTSFLRMHKPEKFGDSLKGIRESVDYVNKYLKPFYGFEEGKIYNGFRHVYPLFDEDNQHLGSVEVSFNIYAFMDKFLDVFNVKRVNFLVNEQAVNEKVFKDETSNYLKSPIKGFYFDKLVLDKLEKLDKNILPNKKTKEELIETAERIKQGKPFFMHFENAQELVVIIPLINKVTKRVVASINIAKNDRFIESRYQEFNQFIIFFFIILAFIILFMYREYISKIKMELEFEKNQKILDSQKSFIIITDGADIKVANQSFLTFYGFKDLGEFKSQYDCICETFEYEEGANYIQKDMDGITWFEYLLNNAKDENLVKILDSNNEEHIFYIEFSQSNKLCDGEYIVTFLDISKIKAIEKQLIQSEKLASLGNMIGNIAHQWRQPLSVISTSASGVKMKNEFNMLKAEEIDAYMDRIVDNTQYLSQTIDTFRNFIRDDSEVKDICIKHELKEIITLVSATLENNFITLKEYIDIDESLIKKMPQGIFIQIISNLVNNAKDVLVDNKIEEPVVILRCEKIAGNIVVSVEDNGGGISENIAQKIFEPYFTTKHESVGTGLGLYMSHKIVTETLNGKLYFKNSENGAKFYVEIPLDE
jgi:nitrogen-specific signal transduction histidine kinase